MNSPLTPAQKELMDSPLPLSELKRFMLKVQIEAYISEHRQSKPSDGVYIIFMDGSVFDWKEYHDLSKVSCPCLPSIADCTVIDSVKDSDNNRGQPSIWMFWEEAYWLHRMMRKYYGFIPDSFEPSPASIKCGLNLQEAYLNYHDKK